MNTNVDFSGTNNQEENVDEADLLKTDGRYIYTFARGILSIIRAYPFYQAEVLSTIKFAAKPSSLFIEGDNMAVFGTEKNKIYGSVTYVKVFNIKNRSDPKQVREYKFEGKYLDGRKTKDGFIYLISNHKIYKRVSPTPWFLVGLIETFLDLDQLFYYKDEYVNPEYVNIFSFNLKNIIKEEVNIVSVITDRAR